VLKQSRVGASAAAAARQVAGYFNQTGHLIQTQHPGEASSDRQVFLKGNPEPESIYTFSRTGREKRLLDPSPGAKC